MTGLILLLFPILLVIAVVALVLGQLFAQKSEWHLQARGPQPDKSPASHRQRLSASAY